MEGSDLLMSLKFNRHFLVFKDDYWQKGRERAQIHNYLQRSTRTPQPATRIFTTSDTANCRDEGHAGLPVNTAGPSRNKKPTSKTE